MSNEHPFWQQIGSIYCINLLEREDRYQHAQKEFDSVGLLERVHFHRVHKHPTSGPIGLFTAFLEVLQLEKDKYVDGTIPKPIAVFEDDLQFKKEKFHYLDELIHFVDGKTQMSYDKWDTIRLGHIRTRFVEQVGQNIYRGNTLSTHCVVYSPCFIERLLKANIDPAQLPGKNAHIDQYLKSVSGRNYIPWEQVVSQGNHGSDISWKIQEDDTDVEKQQQVYLANAEVCMQKCWKEAIELWKETESMTVHDRIKYYHERCKNSDISTYLLEDKYIDLM